MTLACPPCERPGTPCSRALIRWKQTTTLHDLTRKGALVETLAVPASSVAMGPDGALALTFSENSRETLLVRTASGEHRVPLAEVKEHGFSVVALSEDGSLVFVGRPSGMRTPASRPSTSTPSGSRSTGSGGPR